MRTRGRRATRWSRSGPRATRTTSNDTLRPWTRPFRARSISPRMTAATGGSSEHGIEGVVDERLRGLLAEIEGGLTGRTAIRGRQFDLGLAWVSQPLGEGGLGAPPWLQTRIDEALV